MTIESMISTVGFPITMALLMFYMANSSIKKNTEAIHDLKEAILNMRK